MRRALVLMFVALLAGACQSDGASKRDGAAGPSSATPPAGVLRVGVDSVRSLDPAQARSPGELLLAEQLFDSLTRYDPGTLEVRPAVAASWRSTPDQRHWDFTLRPDARFTNGRAITSGDVKYTLERIARRDSGSPVAPELEAVTGFAAVNEQGKSTSLAGVTTPNPGTVHVDLDQPLSSLPALLGNHAFGIVPKEAVEAASPPFAEQPVGSGPFRLQSRQGDVMHLVRAPGVSAALEGIDVKVAREQASSYADFLRGDLDWSDVPPDRVDEASRRRGRTEVRPYLAELFYGFNLKNPRYADVRFREAIVHAVNRDAITKAVYGGTVRSSTSLVVDGVPGHQGDACASKCTYDPDRAKSLLSQVFGGAPVPQVQIDYDDDATQEAIAKAMQANLRDVGIPAALRKHPYTEYATSFARSGQQELFRLGWIGRYPAADDFLTPLFLTGLPDNLMGFSSPPVDQALKAARSEADPSKRTALYQQAERMVMDQLPVIPIAQFQTHSVVAPRVQGLEVSALGTFDATQVRLTAGRDSRRPVDSRRAPGMVGVLVGVAE